GADATAPRDAILVDTSILLDGRLLRLARTGFLHRNLLVPRFVLDELQSLADSRDAGPRRKGRTGLESLEAIQRDTRLRVQVPEDEIPEIEAVDAKLVALATRLSVSLLTNDEALSRVAEIRGVHCLSLDRLSRSLYAARTPGEIVHVTILREGQERGEGIGFIEDGSMVVVADAGELVGQDLKVRITGSATTARGRIFFAAILPD
ncbi:MAG TPA: PIN domain-containing protein, partial [Myxococcota bacterium]|nr:PIN domain-containing protein [Myxococcota bacterium]